MKIEDLAQITTLIKNDNDKEEVVKFLTSGKNLSEWTEITTLEHQVTSLEKQLEATKQQLDAKKNGIDFLKKNNSNNRSQTVQPAGQNDIEVEISFVGEKFYMFKHAAAKRPLRIKKDQMGSFSIGAKFLANYSPKNKQASLFNLRPL